MVFVDFSSAFNTIIPHKLVQKLSNFSLGGSSLCTLILDFFCNRSQIARVGNFTSHTLTLNTGMPKGCVLSPL